MNVSPIPTTRIDKDHPKDQIIGDLNSAIQTRRMTKIFDEHAMVSYINKQRRTNHKDYQNCLFACFLSQKEPKKVIQALADPSWVKVMQEELLKFKLQKVWTLVDLPNGYTQEEGIDYDEVFAPVARIEAIRLFLAYASFMRFIVYQMDVKSAFLYGTIEEEVYVYQPPGFEDPHFPDKVYKKDDGIFINQDKYVADILKKFDFVTVKTASTPMEPNKALVKDEEADNVDVHLYRSMIGSLMYLTASRPDITFAVCACARFQVTPKISHLHAVKRIFRYLKGQPKLGLWYPRDSPFDLEAFSDSDYAGASLDRKSTIGAEYVAAANCCGQVLWIQNQMLDYGFNFMNTKIYIDNESTICIVKNPVFHSKTKHIEIRHHFIRDSYEKKLIQLLLILGKGRMIAMDWRCFLDEIKDRQSNMVGFGEMRQLEVLRLILEEIGYNWYALTKNPTIYVSLIEKFWQTATVRTIDNGEQEINATVDGKEFTITEASVRRHLQLADADGISVLPNTKIFDQLTLMGYVLTDDKLTFQKGTDKAKIIRKWSKTGQTQTRERKSTQRAGRMLSSQPSVNPWSKSQQDKIQNP
ncbi:putative ribonuclease H-like domain-containing protein [Tanacetum coccineum]